MSQAKTSQVSGVNEDTATASNISLMACGAKSVSKSTMYLINCVDRTL